MSTGAESLRVRRLGGDRAGEIRLTRFLRNAAVTTEAMVATAAAETTRRVAGRAVLAIQDTTVIRSEGGDGLYLHPCWSWMPTTGRSSGWRMAVS